VFGKKWSYLSLKLGVIIVGEIEQQIFFLRRQLLLAVKSLEKPTLGVSTKGAPEWEVATIRILNVLEEQGSQTQIHSRASF